MISRKHDRMPGRLRIAQVGQPEVGRRLTGGLPDSSPRRRPFALISAHPLPGGPLLGFELFQLFLEIALPRQRFAFAVRLRRLGRRLGGCRGARHRHKASVQFLHHLLYRILEYRGRRLPPRRTGAGIVTSGGPRRGRRPGLPAPLGDLAGGSPPESFACAPRRRSPRTKSVSGILGYGFCRSSSTGGRPCFDALALVEPVRDRPRDHDDHLDVVEDPAHMEKTKDQVTSLK